MHSSISRSAAGLAHLLLGDDHPLDALLLGDPRRCRRSRRAAAARPGWRLARRRRGSRPARRRASGWVATRRATSRRRRPGPITRPIGDAGQRGARRSGAAPRSDEAAGEDADADDDRAARRERPGRAERQQAVEREGAERAGRDQRRQLVEGAVADPAVVVVVEAVELEDQDPDRAEEHRPEEGRDVGVGGRRGGDAERARSAPASRRPRAAGAAVRRAAAISSAMLAQPRRAARPGAARPGRRGERLRGWRRGWRAGLLARWASFAAVPAAGARAGSVAAPFRGRAAPPLRRRPRARPSSAGSTTASCRPRVRSPC